MFDKISYLFAIVSVLLITLFVSACSSSKNYYLEPEFKNSKTNGTVLIMPIDRFRFGNFQHTFGSLSGDERTTFNSQLAPLFSQYANVRVSMLNEDEMVDTENFKISSLQTEDNMFETIIPAENANLSFSGEQPRFVLMLDQYYYRQKEEEVGGGSYAGHEPEIQRTLYFETKYVYWDTTRKQPVGWGVSTASSEVSVTVTRSDYVEVLSKAVRKIVNQGPIVATP